MYVQQKQMMNLNQYNQSVQTYADGLYRFIYKSIGNQADAEDIVQTTYEKLWKNKDNVEQSKLKSYLYTIAYNTMIDHIRKNKRTEYRDAQENETLPTYTNTTQLKQILDLALQKLNETQRSLVLLKDYEGYSYTEIAVIMDLTESQVKVYLHRARLILKNYIVSTHHVI